jgi:hypothetical protein
LTSEHRAILEQIRSSADIVQRAVNAAQSGCSNESTCEGEWSALEIFIHLRDVVIHAYGLRIRRLLYEHAPAFADLDEDSYCRASLTRDETVSDILAMIVAEHEQLVRLLKVMPDAEWLRQGRRPLLGAMSIEFLARRVGEYAQEHAKQIEAAEGGKNSVAG